MPTISEFFGILIRMYYNEESSPHFHAIYGDFEMRVLITSLSIIDGQLPVRQERLVLKWAKLHQEELKVEWRKVEAKEPLFKIEPLE